MSVTVFNKLEKLAAPPFITVAVLDAGTRKNIFTTWTKLKLDKIAEKTTTFNLEGDLLKAFILRKGTQLRLEKALMFTRRIHTLFTRWKCNAFWEDFSKFKNAFESDDAKLKPTKKIKSAKTKGNPKKTDRVKGPQEIRLPSRQWCNWVVYLVLRDILLLAKIKHECERTVGYWLGLISCSHHPGDSLIIVGILSRIWAVSSGMVEDYANQVYSSLCFISSLLSTTKADNWLEDIDFPDELFTWLEKILGFPFKPALIGGYEQIFRKDESKSKSGSGSTTSGFSKMDTILCGVFGSSQEDDGKVQLVCGGGEDVASTSSRIRDLSGKCKNDDDEEDIGVPVHIQLEQPTQPKKKKNLAGEKQNKKSKGKASALSSSGGKSALPSRQTNRKVVLDERWTNFFKNFKTKLDSEAGRKKLLARIRKYKNIESNQEICERLIKLRKFVKGNKQDKLQIFVPKFKRFLSKRIA